MRCKVFKILVVASFFSILAFTCWAAPSTPIVMVEADLPPVGGDNTVEFTITSFNFNAGTWTIGEWTSTSFIGFIDENTSNPGLQVSRPGGTIVDFAIYSTNYTSTPTTLYLSQGNHEVTFAGVPNSGVAESPSDIDVWYDDFAINWYYNNTQIGRIELINSGDDPDGFAAVPIPASVLLLGTGLIGLVGFRRLKVQS